MKKYIIFSILIISSFLVIPKLNADTIISYNNAKFDVYPMRCSSQTECYTYFINTDYLQNISIGEYLNVQKCFDGSAICPSYNGVRKVVLKQSVNLVANETYSFTYYFGRDDGLSTNLRGTIIESAKYRFSTDDLYSFSVNTINITRGDNYVTLTFTPTFNTSYVEFRLSLGVTTSSTSTYNEIISNQFGYPTSMFSVTYLEIKNVIIEDDTQDVIINQNNTIINQNQNLINNQELTNNKLDNIYESDLSDTDKEQVDDTILNEYENAENDVLDKINDVDLDNVDISMDVNSTNFIWELITDIFNSHPVIMSTVIAILSIGIIKLALGR